MKRGVRGMRVRGTLAGWWHRARCLPAVALIGVGLALAGCDPGTPRAAEAEEGASAHPEEEAILAAVQRLFDGMAERDTAAVARAMHPEGHLLAVPVGEGAPAPRGMSRAEFVELIGQPGPPVIERMWDAQVLVHEPIAVVWTPYDLWVGEEFSHCGVDGLTMIRTQEGWKVAGGIYTLEREGCPESPFGPPGGR